MGQLLVRIVNTALLVEDFRMNVVQKYQEIQSFTAYHAVKAARSPPIMTLLAVFCAVHPVQKISWLIKLAQQHQMSSVQSSVTVRTGNALANLKN